MSQKIIDHIKEHAHIKTYLKQALKKRRLAHALLFSGPSGIGKRKMAWALAQMLLCETSTDPTEVCGSCYNCLSLNKQKNEHVLCVHFETLQIRLQDVKNIPKFLALQSAAKAKIVLIDQAEKLNIQASNFLLKILEEPPEKSYFFLISSEASQLAITIRSRVQAIQFKTLSLDTVKQLAPNSATHWMIRGARGQMDKIEDLINLTDIRERSFYLWSRLLTTAYSSLEYSKNIHNKEEALLCCRFWQQFLRDAYFIKMGLSKELIHGDKIQNIKKTACWPYEFLNILIKKTLNIEADILANADYIICFEYLSTYAQKHLKLSST